MLKITNVDTPTEHRLVLEGRLTDPDTRELESAWANLHRKTGAGRWIIDLRNITFIDERAEAVLLGFSREGAQFIACGVANTYRLEQLGIKCKETLRSRL